jgi:hypothetical protein
MYIKGISKVLIVTVFLVSLFLFTPQRVEAAKLPPETYCVNNGYTIIGGFTGNPDTCCPTEDTWKSMIPTIANSKDINTVTSVGSTYLSVLSLGNCFVKYDATTNKGTTLSGQEAFFPGDPVAKRCPNNTCVEKDALGTITTCYTQYEQYNNKVCCVSANSVGVGLGSFEDVKNCSQATNVPPVAKAGNQITVRGGKLSLRNSDTICTEDARDQNQNVINDVYKKCKACLDDGKQWTALGCIDTGQQGTGIVVFLMQIFYGIGFTFILVKFILAGIQLQSGDPEAIKEAKETFIAGISALFVAGFGLILLRYIGFDILGLGDFLGTQFPVVK